MQLYVILVLLQSLLYQESTAITCCGICQCVNKVINCDSKDLNDIPNCPGNDNTYDALSIRFNNLTNPTISRIPAGISKLDFSDNLITAFNPTSANTAVKVLILENNLLSSVPSMRNFPNLEDLDVSLNPIPSSGFTDDVMRTLGSKLKSIHIGDSDMFSTFPRSISTHLQNLDTLEIKAANQVFQFLPPNAFHAFESRLKNLTIRNTHLQAIPLTLRSARNLEEFHFDGNPIGDDGILAESFVGLKKLKILSLKNDGITTFPEIVNHLDNLRTFALDGNILLYIREDAFNMINRSDIIDLSLGNCSLDRIPGALSSHTKNFLSRIQKLNFADNNIQSIDRNDLNNLQSLTRVSFAGNPLQYISSDAFTGLPDLQTIDFSKTRLQSVPEAVKHIHNLNKMVLNGTDVDCTCDLVDIKKWIDKCSPRLKFDGSCETISSSLQNYLNTFVPSCPFFSSVNANCIAYK